MPDPSEESKRISMQLSYISTQLIESMDKQTQLEDKLRKSRRTIQEQEAIIQQYTDLKMKYDQLDKNFIQKKIQVGKLETELEKDRQLRVDAENKVDVLNKEVEELTASLFDEANKMVATARREAEDVEIRSMKLLEQIHEKDTILETLTLQLKNLKKVLHDLQTENSSNGTTSNRGSVIMNDSVNLSSYSLNKVPTSNSFSVQDLSHFAIYTPRVPAIRFDLYMYDEFLKFIAVLPYCDSIKQTASESKLLRRLVNDEVTPVLRLDNANGLGWLIKRTLMTMMIEGLVVIEPLSGVNETYRTGNTFPNVKLNQSFTKSFENKGSHLFNFPADSPPVALHEPCAFCGECRDDIIEHARMYVLKTQSKSDDGTLTITNQFPLCQNCLIKVRQTCEIFAFLRSLKLGAWNLEKVTLATIAKGDSKKFTKVTSSGTISEDDINEKNMKRRSFMAGLGMNSLGCTRVKTETAISLVDQAGLPTTNIQRAWIQLCKLRSMLHWAHIGVWSSENSISTTFGPQSADMGNMDNQSSSDLSESESSNIMNSKSISEESFTSVKEDGDDSEFFDFENNENNENNDNTFEVTKVEDTTELDADTDAELTTENILLGKLETENEEEISEAVLALEKSEFVADSSTNKEIGLETEEKLDQDENQVIDQFGNKNADPATGEESELVATDDVERDAEQYFEQDYAQDNQQDDDNDELVQENKHMKKTKKNKKKKNKKK